MNRHIATALCAASLLSLSPLAAVAQGPFHLSPALDYSLGASGIGLLGFDMLYTKVLEKDDGIDSYTVRDKDDVWAFDRWAMHDYDKTMGNVSTAGMYLTSALPLVFFAAPKEDWGTIYAMYAETVFLSQGVKEFTKAFVDRDRPYMYYEGAPSSKLDDGDYHDSFFSGHATTSFAAATFTSYVFCKEFPDSKWKIPVIATSYVLATTTAALRVAGGSHFLSDVLVGAAFGSLTGWLVPYLHTLNSPGKDKSGNFASLTGNDSFQIAASPFGITASLTF
ncbi:MAG: phosphatase PAP2 family protein [Sphaerochaetaceae bacterium]|nr:phosphatase PAP2 family protein [Spirochaetales bacterium]MDY5500425.1 phosphatase PAP2 family protein [Sphaerochaetaceae bacterium]